jgi:hypothetical protein
MLAIKILSRIKSTPFQAKECEGSSIALCRAFQNRQKRLGSGKVDIPFLRIGADQLRAQLVADVESIRTLGE